jgi:hypothetical protein
MEMLQCESILFYGQYCAQICSWAWQQLVKIRQMLYALSCTLGFCANWLIIASKSTDNNGFSHSKPMLYSRHLMAVYHIFRLFKITTMSLNLFLGKVVPLSRLFDHMDDTCLLEVVACRLNVDCSLTTVNRFAMISCSCSTTIKMARRLRVVKRVSYVLYQQWMTDRIHSIDWLLILALGSNTLWNVIFHVLMWSKIDDQL